MMKRFFLGNAWFQPPFYADRFWVQDATGKKVAEAFSQALAKEIAEMLNAKTKGAK
jgi:hypothetical protein